MRQTIKTKSLLFTAILLVCSSLIYLGCKKVSESNEPSLNLGGSSVKVIDASTEVIIKSWISDKRHSANYRQQKNIDSLLSNVIWQQGVKANVSNGKSVIYIPTNNPRIGLGFFYDAKNNHIDSGNIIKVISNGESIPNAQIRAIQAYYENIILHHKEPSEFSGIISAYSITNKFLYDYTFYNGATISHGLAAPKPQASSLRVQTDALKVNAVECEVWGHWTFWESGAVTLDYTWLVCTGTPDCTPPHLAVSPRNGELYIKSDCDEGEAPPEVYNGGGSEQPDMVRPHLCQSYNWATVGNSYTTGINKLYYEFNSVSTTLRSRIEEACVTIPNHSNLTQAQANLMFNTAFNLATESVRTLLEQGLISRTESAVKSSMKGWIQTYLAAERWGAVVSFSGCSGSSIPVTTLNYNSFC